MERELQQQDANAYGITFCSLAALASDLDRDEKLCQLHNAFIVDVPPRGERTLLDVDTFRHLQITCADNLPDAHIVAVHKSGAYVGVSGLRLPPDRNPRELYTGITGVAPEWRQKGIALALKWQGIRYAKNHGVSILKTWNSATNKPVLALNRRLGFVREPWRIHFVKEFGSEDRP